MYPRQIQRLIALFSKFPTVGQRTAARFSFYILQLSQNEADELLKAVQDLKREILLCKLCYQPFDAKEGKDSLCPVCSNPARDQSLLCIVEKESDLEALESARQYPGLYFVLGGTLGALKKEELKGLRIQELKARLAHSPIQEIIIATNPTTEGEATALYLERLLKDFSDKITRLGRGLPIGGELEYADPETLKQSLENRR